MPSSQKYIAVVAGKSGGHIIPGMTYAHQFINKHPEYKLVFFSTDTKLDRSILALYPSDFIYISLSLEGVPGRNIVRYPFFFIQVIRAFFISNHFFAQYKPESVMSMGGIISMPVCLAARFRRIPFDLFELNAVPGKAVVWLAPLARHIYICFEEARAYFKKIPTTLTHYPLRFNQADRMTKEAACKHLGLDPFKKILVILGGSQGSHAINEMIKTFIEKYIDWALASGLQVIHQTGAGQQEKYAKLYASLGIPALVFDYDHSLQYTYSAADLIIARAGAGSLFEIEFFQKKAIIIPLEIASTSHQLDNAYAMQKHDCIRASTAQQEPLFKVLRQQEICADPEILYRSIPELLS